MQSHPAHAVTLTCHPGTPAAAAHAVSARIDRTPDGVLAICYTVEGDIERLHVPAPTAPAIADRLWEHTCCEAFIARRGLPAYHEFNFSPSGEWAVYVFERYRERAPFAGCSNVEELDPHICLRVGKGKLELDVRIRLDRVSPVHAVAELALALSAVVEERDGTLSYWALKHRPGTPDFHHPDAYALALAETGISTARSPA